MASQKFDVIDGLDITGEIVSSGNLVIDTDTLYVDATNDRVGINKIPAAGYGLDVTGSIRTNSQLVSSATTGTAPINVTSTTLVSNLNADLLDGQQGSYYLDYTNTTNKPTIGNATITFASDGTGGLKFDTDSAFTTNQTSNETITIDHAIPSGASAGTIGQLGAEDGTYIKSITTDKFGHVTAVTSDDFDNRYDNYGSWTIQDGDTTTYTITSGDTLQIKAGDDIKSDFTADDELTISHLPVTLNANTNNTSTLTHEGTFKVLTDLERSNTGHLTRKIYTTFTMPAGAVPNNGSLSLAAATTPVSLSYSSGGTFTADKATESVLQVVHDTITQANTTSGPTSITHGGTFTAVTSVNYNQYGHIGGFNTHTYTLPAGYTHPSYTARNIDTSGVEVLDLFTSDALGHVTNITKRTLPNANTTVAGVVSTSAQTFNGAKTFASGLTTNGPFTSPGIDDNATSTAITIDSNENVGIGTTNISALLHLKDLYPLIRFEDEDGVSGVTYEAGSSGGNFIFNNVTGATQPLTIDSNDVVTMAGGVSSTTTTDGTLVVTGGVGISENLNVGGNLTVDTNTFFVDATNNRVGIGTSSPSARLHVSPSSSSGDQGEVAIYLGNENTSGRTAAFIKNTTAPRSLKIRASNSAADPEPIIFETDSTNEGMRLTDTGRLGINNNNPTYTLDVKNTGTAYAPVARFVDNGEAINWARVDILNTNTTNHNGLLLYQDNNGACSIRSDNNGTTALPLNFIAGGTQAGHFYWYNSANGPIAMSLNSNGNVGIGVSTANHKLTLPQVDGTSIGMDAGAGFTLNGTNCTYYGLTYQELTGTVFNTILSGYSNVLFATLGAERMRLDPNGNVGIGTDNPTAELHISREGEDAVLYISASGSQVPATIGKGIINMRGGDASGFHGTSSITTEHASNGAGKLTFDVSAGALGGSSFVFNTGTVSMTANEASTSTTSGTLRVTGGVGISGDVNVGGDVNSLSDVRLKSNVESITNALDIVKALRGVSYIKDEKASIGLIAQEVKEVLPQVVNGSEEEYYSVAYGNIVGVLIEAIKELENKIAILESK